MSEAHSVPYTIDLSDLRTEISVIPDQMHKILIRLQKLLDKYNEAKTTLSLLEHEISADINLNPEKYGFPLGSAPERFKVMAKIHSQPSYIKQAKTVDYLHSRLQAADVEKQCLTLKFEALKCLLQS